MTPTRDQVFDYDVALSYAGEDRAYVEQADCNASARSHWELQECAEASNAAQWEREDDVTVYAYKMRHQVRWGREISDPWFNLTADTQDELHEFAARLGLPRQGFQPGSLIGPKQVSVSWHYTVTASEHDRAIELGAQRSCRGK
jgi:hypothetical protein